MQVRNFSFTALFSIVMLCSCATDEIEDDYSDWMAKITENSISIDGVYGAGYLSSVNSSGTTKGTPITDGVDVTSIGIYTNVRSQQNEQIGLTTYLENSEIARNIYGKLEFLTDAYWPVLAENESLGFIAYSPYTDVFTTTTEVDDETVTTTTGTTTASGLSNPSSENMTNFYITYEVPDNVANQPDLLVSEPVEQTTGSVSLVFNHALATVKFNVLGDGIHPVSSIEVSDIISRGRLHASYSSTNGVYSPKFEWDTDPDDTGVQTKDFMLSLDAGTLSEVSPSEEAVTISSQTGYLMMIPQTVSAATEYLVTFTDGMSRSVRFFDNQVWEAGGIYSYNINISFEGDIIDFSDYSTVNTLVNNTDAATTDLETANCYILNPPVYSKEQEEAAKAAKAATTDDDETLTSTTNSLSTSEPLVFTRSTDDTSSTESLETEEVSYGALYYIPITTQMKRYYEDYITSSVPKHENWTPLILWYDCPEDPTTAGVIIKRVDADNGEERFSVYIPYDYTNFGNISIGVKSDTGPIIWSWHLWVTDYNPYYDRTLGYTAKATGDTGAYTVNVEGGELHHYRDNQATPVYYWSGIKYYLNRLIMDRNLGSLNNNGGTHAENASTGGLYYQYARKDPFPRGAASLDYYTPVNRTYATSVFQSSDLGVAIETPLTFYNFGANTTYVNTTNGSYNFLYTWYSIADFYYVWGDKNYTNTEAGEYFKSLFDPSPIGFMVPTINVWNDFVLGSASTGITLSSTTAGGISYSSGVYGDTTDDYLLAQYPLSNSISGSTGAWTSTTWSGCWTSTPIVNYSNTTTNYPNYNWANFLYFTNGIITRCTTYDTNASRTMGHQVRPIQRWYGDAPISAHAD